MHGWCLAYCLALGKDSVNSRLLWALRCIGSVSWCVLTQINEGGRTYPQTLWASQLLPMDSEVWPLPQRSRLFGGLQKPLGWQFLHSLPELIQAPSALSLRSLSCSSVLSSGGSPPHLSPGCWLWMQLETPGNIPPNPTNIPWRRQLVPYHPAEERSWGDVATGASGNGKQQQLSRQGPKAQDDETKACVSQGASDHLPAREHWTLQNGPGSSLPRNRALFDAWGADFSKRGVGDVGLQLGPQLPSFLTSTAWARARRATPNSDSALILWWPGHPGPGRTFAAGWACFWSSGPTVWCFAPSSNILF